MNLFRTKYRKGIRWVWQILSVLVIISMIALYTGLAR